MITPEEEEQIFADIWRQAVTVFALPLVLFNDTFKELEKALFRGFGGNLSDFEEGSRELILLTELRGNINRFSAAKTFQNIRDTQNLRLDEGLLRPFPEFRTDAKKIFDTYNDDWLKAEFETTAGMAQSADQWIDIQRDQKTLPLLKYVTAGDNRVRPEHAAWDGIVKPVDDPFWNSHNPPNGYRCFEPSTKILTPNGWKKISEINRGEFVIGGSGEKRNVIGVHINKSKTGLIKLESKNSSILCTPNHRILTTKGWVTAGELKTSDVIIQHPEPILNNTRIRNIDKVNTFISNVLVTFVVKWNSVASKTFNSQFHFGDININPIRSKVKVENGIMNQRVDIIKHYLFTFGRLCLGVYVSFGMLFKKLFSGGGTLMHNILSPKGSADFKFFRNNSKRLGRFFGFAKVMMGVGFKIFTQSLFEILTLLFSSFGVVNPLGFYRFASPSGFNPKMLHQLNDGSVIHAPSLAKHSVSKELVDVKISDSFFGGAPLEGFDSLKDFIRYSFFHLKFVRLSNITKVQYTDNVYNLSVDKDETYITELGIVHNCRCVTVQLEEGEEDITNLGDHLKKVKKETNGKVTTLANDDPLFAINPGKAPFIFKDKGSSPHPYFLVPENMKFFKDANFGLPAL